MKDQERYTKLFNFLERHFTEVSVEVRLHRGDWKPVSYQQPALWLATSIDPQLDPYLLAYLLAQTGHPFAVILLGASWLHGKRKDWKGLAEGNISEQPILQSNKKWRKKLKVQLQSGHHLGFCLNFFVGLRDLPVLNQEIRLLDAARKIGATIVPVNFSIQQEAGKRIVLIRIGHVLSGNKLHEFRETLRMKRFLQAKIQALGSALQVMPFFTTPATNHEEIISAVPVKRLEAEIQSLEFEDLISERGRFQVFISETQRIPQIMREIGRLRETTFRSVGEGTGHALDVDEFDLYYHQLFIWDKEAKCIVGGYRIGKGDDIFLKYGPDGFYIHSFFKIQKGFYPIMQQAVELGRSFVIQSYQKQPLPLFLLWQGILYFLLKHAHLRYIYGPVSISKYYSNLSKSLIVEFIKANYYDEELARHLSPRTPFKPDLAGIDVATIMRNLGSDMASLDKLIEEIEPAHIRIPILLKQYVKQNAKFISFNLDPNFSDVLDGFMILDLKHLPVATIEALKKDGS
ncbi:MAG: GNAT family N-acyltransferase [Saprospiraceae bacterium]